jgi:hypothetical protein
MSPVGWIPEKTRATTPHTTGDVGVFPGHLGGPEVRRLPQEVGYPAPVPYEVSTPVFEGPFDLLLHLILKEEVDLWEISLARIVGRSARAGAHAAARPRIGDRVPADRRDARRVEGAPIAARPRRRRHRRGAVAVRAARPAARAPSGLQDVPGRREGAAHSAGRGRPRGRAQRRPRGAVPLDGSDPLSGLARRLPRRRPLCAAPKPEPEVETDHVAPIRASVRAVETVLALLPDRRSASATSR